MGAGSYGGQPMLVSAGMQGLEELLQRGPSQVIRSPYANMAPMVRPLSFHVEPWNCEYCGTRWRGERHAKDESCGSCGAPR